MASAVMSTGTMVTARTGGVAALTGTRGKSVARMTGAAPKGTQQQRQSVGVTMIGRRGGRGLVVRAAGDEEETQQPMSQTRKRSPKPLPSSFGEGKVTGKKTLPFQDPFETKTGGKPIASPFDMPASAADPSAPAATTPATTPAAANPASPFGATAPAAGAAKPASPFGAAAPPAGGGAAKPASPFGAAAPPAAGASGAAPASGGGGSPFADTSAFGAAPTAAPSGSPFAQSGSAANPFGDAAAGGVGGKKAARVEKVDERSAWEKIPKPAMAQVVIVLSFTTIITLMLATFWVVVQLGGVSFNDS